MPKIAGRKANGRCGCAPVGYGSPRAGPQLNAGHWCEVLKLTTSLEVITNL